MEGRTLVSECLATARCNYDGEPLAQLGGRRFQVADDIVAFNVAGYHGSPMC
jgi:hypothetical protein